MANRRFYQFGNTLEREVVKLFLELTIGAAGAITAAKGAGFQSIERTATGDWTVTLGKPAGGVDKYTRLVSFSPGIGVDGDDMGVPFVGVVADNAASDGTIDLTCFAADGTTPADPSDGTVLRMEFTLVNAPGTAPDVTIV